MRVRVPEGDAGGAKGGSEREGVGSARAWRERERERVCVCVCVRVRVRLRERERERVCVWMDAVRVHAIRYETIRGAAPRELGTDKQKRGVAIEVDGE